MSHFVRPFCIIRRIGEQAYKVQLPPTMEKIHPVFHVSQLKLSTTDIREQPGPVLIDGELQYEVEHVLAEEEYIYRIRWMGYYPSYDSWISK